MNHYILHVSHDGSGHLPWPLNLASRGIVLLQAAGQAEALPYCRAYPLMMVLIDVAGVDEAWMEGFEKMRAAIQPGVRPAMIGLILGELAAPERTALAEAGLEGLVSARDPECFLVRRIETLANLEDLKSFEQSRVDIGQLATRTREHLHELSQPLSAIQGRLQLLAARCPESDPNAESFNELVRLSLKVSQSLQEIQKLHRKYS